MTAVRVEDDAIYVGNRFSVSFQRTLRIPEDGHEYPLPPGFGRFPIHLVDDFADRVPSAWLDQHAVMIPMYQREALWLAFDGAAWKPNAVQVAVGGINAISGRDWEQGLSADTQNYIVCPDQPWLDGINSADGVVRQFVAMPLGEGFTVEEQLTGKAEFGGIQIRVFEPLPGRFPDQPPEEEPDLIIDGMAMAGAAVGMGIGAGGRIRQRVYPDTYGIDCWDVTSAQSVLVYIVNSIQFERITGTKPPPTPISAKDYTDAGFPWFELYDETMGDVAASDSLRSVKSVRDVAVEKGTAEADSDEGTTRIDPDQVQRIPDRPGRAKNSR